MPKRLHCPNCKKDRYHHAEFKEIRHFSNPQLTLSVYICKKCGSEITRVKK